MAGMWDWISDNAWNLGGAALNVGSGVAGYYASKDAGKQQSDAANTAAANFRPYAAIGDQAAGEMAGRLNKNSLLRDFAPGDMKKDPGYQFRLDQGNQAIDRAAGARGSRYSGATLKGLQRYAQDYATGEYQNAYNRYNTDRTMNYNFLSGAMNTGMGAQGQVGNYMGNAADARAAGAMGGANSLWGGMTDAYNGVNSRANNNQFMTWLQSQYNRKP